MRKSQLISLLVFIFFSSGVIEFQGKTLSGRVLRTTKDFTIYLASSSLEYRVNLAPLECPPYLNTYIRPAWEILAFDLIFRLISVEYESLRDNGSISGQVFLNKRWINRELIDMAKALYQQHQASLSSTTTISKPPPSVILPQPQESQNLSLPTLVTEKAKVDGIKTQLPIKFKNPQLKSLNGVKPIYVSIAPIHSELIKIGLNEVDIKVKAELSLKNHGIEMAPSRIENSGNLIINLSWISRDIKIKYVSVEMKFSTDAEASEKANVDQWHLGSLVFFVNEQDITKIYDSIARKLDLFIKDYLKANPKPIPS